VLYRQGFGRCGLSTPQIPAKECIPVSEYVKGTFVPLSHLAHGWEIHSLTTLSPAEERTMVREPAQAVPATMAARIGPLRVLMVPYIACEESGDVVCRAKPKGESHISAWLETEDRINLLLACREANAHDTGFEFLASVAELLRPRLTSSEVSRYVVILDDELNHKVKGEIDEDARAAKEILLSTRFWRRKGAQYGRYRDISLVSTMAEYVHGLWHDVQVHIGPEHLPVEQLRRRINLMAGMFPPNPGYALFAKELEEELENKEL